MAMLMLVPGHWKMWWYLKRPRSVTENAPNGATPTSNRHPSLKPSEIFQLAGL